MKPISIRLEDKERKQLEEEAGKKSHTENDLGLEPKSEQAPAKTAFL